MNKTETAERSYKWAIKLSPRFIDAYYNIGNLLLATGEPGDFSQGSGEITCGYRENRKRHREVGAGAEARPLAR